MRLYRIKESEIQGAIDSPEREETEGDLFIAYRTFPGRFSGLPLKVVYVVEDDKVVVTAYPLKKSYI
jgi:hypothetical protein